MTLRNRALAAALLLCLCAPAAAQQALFTDAATQPSQNVFLLRQLIRYDQLEGGIDDLTYSASLFYGLTPEVSFSLRVPVRYRDGEDIDGAFGLDDVHAMAKWRVWKNDFGPLDTARLAVFGGASLPVGKDEFTSDSIDPMIGSVFTLIRGRHGINTAATWRFNSGDEDALRFGSGPDDALRLDANYVFRIAPAEFNADNSGGGWYGFVELNSEYETNGDRSLFVAPGIMYEGSDVSFEAAIRVPAWNDVDHRPEEELAVSVGVRIFL